MMDVLLEALRQLWAAGGAPSYRVMRDRIRDKYDGNGPSHMTIYQAINGQSLPSLDVLMQIVEALGGDGDFFRELWIDVRLASDLPIPAAVIRNGEIADRLARIEDRLEGIEQALANR